MEEEEDDKGHQGAGQSNQKGKSNWLLKLAIVKQCSDEMFDPMTALFSDQFSGPS